jgi:hypothetical protein
MDRRGIIACRMVGCRLGCGPIHDFYFFSLELFPAGREESWITGRTLIAERRGNDFNGMGA